MRDAKGEGTAQLLDHLKKGEMATEAERLLKGSGWLSEVLLRADVVAFDDATAAEGQGASFEVHAERAAEMPDDSETVDLPAFLIADMPVPDAPMMAAE